MIAPINKGNGKWLLRVSCGYAYGQKKMIRRTIQLNPAMTENAQRREAEKQTAMLMADYEAGRLTDNRPITLQQFSGIWWRDYVERRGLADKTKQYYKILLDGRILPQIGKYKLRDIRPQTLNRFYAWLAAQGISGTTMHKYHGVLYTMLKCAVRWQMIAVNPADAVEPPKLDTKEFTAYTDEQAHEMLEALKQAPTQWQAYVLLALYGQLRRGEMVGLDWKNVEGDTVKVVQSAIYVPGEGIKLKAPKTASGVRNVVIPRPVVDALRRWKAEQSAQHIALGEAWQECGAVFTQWDGQRMHPDTPTRWFEKFLKRNGLPHIRLHDLRHTGASLLIASGMDIETVKNRLGHSKASTTMDIYGHAYAKNDARAADLLESILHR